MMIGIWGHSAIGKTTWLESIADDLARLNRQIVLVYADVQQECRPMADRWLCVRRTRWKGEKQERLAVTPKLIADNRIWIVESMRWFIGMQIPILEAWKANGRHGLHMTILYSQPEVQKQMRWDRCQLLGKDWNTYWDDYSHLKVESYRSFNSIKHHWAPNKVPYKAYEIRADRVEFNEVTKDIKRLVSGGLELL